MVKVKVMKEMLLSGLLGGLGEWTHLVVCHILDRYMDKRTSNFIGLLVDMTIDFFYNFGCFCVQLKYLNILIIGFLLNFLFFG